MSIAGEIAEQQYSEYEQKIARLRELVRSAYYEGFAEGIKEQGSGGRPWRDSDAKKRMDATT